MQSLNNWVWLNQYFSTGLNADEKREIVKNFENFKKDDFRWKFRVLIKQICLQEKEIYVSEKVKSVGIQQS